MARKPKGSPEFEAVMKGLDDPKRTNAHHKAQLKKEDAKRKAVQRDLDKRKGKHTRRKGDDGVIDSGMFNS